MQEKFKDIDGYEGLYQVSNFGTVISLPKGDGNGNRLRILKFDIQEKNHTTYHRVTLSKLGKTKRFQVHRLVAMHFIPNAENNPMVNHIDNDGRNNNVNNLEWCTGKENMKHSANQGRQEEALCKAQAAAAIANVELSNERYKNMIGSIVHKLTIVDFYIDKSLNRSTVKFICKCNCGNTTEKNLDQLKRTEAACNECSRRAAAIKRKQGRDIVSTI
jgi:hypothetical protein